MANRIAYLLAFAVMLAGAAAIDPCAPTFNFFPTAEEIGEPQLVNNVTCKGDMVCNFPAVWAPANQSAYLGKLGTTAEGGLLSVAYRQYGNEAPRLFFTPQSPFLKQGAVSSACAASLMEPAATRRLQAEELPLVVRPGRWSYTVSYDGAAPVPGQRIGSNAGQLDPKMLVNEGSHCAKITVTVDGMQTRPAIPGLSRVSGVQTVCWYRLAGQATAKLQFDMCSSPVFTVNVSGIAPLAQNLTQNGSTLSIKGKPALLFRPVLQLFGQKSRSLDGTIIKELEYDNMNNPINFINKYIMLPTDLSSKDTISIPLDQDSLDEGYYRMSAKVALISQFPDLVDLTGKTPIVQADAYGEDVRGSTEYSAVTLINDTSMVGVQKSKTTVSEITSDRVGKTIKSGDTITFFWKFAGIGTERCFHDDKEIVHGCMSGMSVPAGDVANRDRIHTFRVVFTDMCGNTKDAEYSYTQEGVKTVTKIDYIPVQTAASATAKLPTGAKKPANGASSSAHVGLVGLALALLAAATVL